MIRTSIKFLISAILWVLFLGIPVDDHNLHFHAHKFILGNKLTRQAISKTKNFRHGIKDKWDKWYSSAMESDGEGTNTWDSPNSGRF